MYTWSEDCVTGICVTTPYRSLERHTTTTKGSAQVRVTFAGQGDSEQIITDTLFCTDAAGMERPSIVFTTAYSAYCNFPLIYFT